MTSRRGWWPLATAAGVSVGSSVLTVALLLGIQQRSAEQDRIARHELQVAQESQRAALCQVVVNFDDNYMAAPPTTEAGIRNAASIARLRTGLHCPPRS
jgi:hypothetical protein